MTMCPCTIVPTYHCAHTPVEMLSGNVLFCPRVTVPTYHCAQQWKPSICPNINVSMYRWAHLCPHTCINVKGQSDPNWVSDPYQDQRSKCPKLGHSDQCWGQTWWPTLGQVTVDHHDQVWVNKIFDSMWLIMTQFGSQWPFELNIGHYD